MEARHDESETAGGGVVRRWRALASARRAGESADWFDRAVPVLAAAVATYDAVDPAAISFGGRRCEAGWTLTEVLDDLEDLMTATPAMSSAARWQLVRATAEGWSQEAIASTIAAPFRDPLTGLPTIGYLIPWAEVLYGGRDGPLVHETHSLVIIRPLDRRGLERVLRTIEVAELVARSLGPRCALAALEPHGVVALVENVSASYEGVLDVAGCVDLEVVLEPMPRSLRDLEARLAVVHTLV